MLLPIKASNNLSVFIYPVLIMAALLITRYHNGILLFHTLAELFAIFVGMLMLVVVLNTRHFIRNDFLVYLGVGYFGVSILDAMHTFTVHGLPFFNTSDVEITLHFWIYGRLFEAILLATAPIFLWRKLNSRIAVLSVVVLISALSLLAFYQPFPRMMENGELTPYKITAELVVIAMLLVSIAVYYANRKLMAGKVVAFTICSMLLTICAELCFTLYTSFQSPSFVIGHLLKFLSFWMIYQAIVQTTLNEPLKLLTRSSNSYDAIPHSAVRTDGDAIILQVNRAAVNCIEHSRTELIHKPIHGFYHPEGINEHDCHLCQAIKSGESISNEEVYFPQNQQWYLVSIAPVDPLQKAGGMVQSLTNITKQKQQEAELIEHKATLEQRVVKRTQELEVSLTQLQKTQNQLVESKKMASLGGMVAGVAHELNTPIGISVTASSFLKEATKQFSDDFNDNNLSRKNLKKFIDDALQSSQLIDDNLARADLLMKNFKQVAINQESQCYREFYLKAHIGQVIDSIKLNEDAPPLELVFDRSDDFIVHSSPTALAQVVTNLIDNALLHGVNQQNDGRISLDVRTQDGTVYLTIADNGKGILPEHLPSIFEPFFTTNRYKGGTGLGLHLVYNLVMQSLKGTIQCESKLNEGAVFTLEFPANI